MRDRLTDGVRLVLQLAASAAHHDGVVEFGADYVFLGLAHYREVYGAPRVATAVLDDLNVSFDAFAQTFGHTFGPRKPQASAPRAKPAPAFMDAAWAEASNLHVSLQGDYVCSEHLLLAIARSDSMAAIYLRDAGADYKRIRQAILQLMGIHESNEGQPT